MECLQIDWKNIDGTFEKDEFYENIHAPKWIDFTAPLQPADDHAWFCGKAGCTHETKSFLQVLNQGNANPFDTSMKSSVNPSTAKTLSAGVAVKKSRPVVSSSLSSLSEIKTAYAKNKVLHQMQMPFIRESKAEAAKNNRRQQASENENPNRAGKLQDGACKKPTLRALEVIARQTKTSESKGFVGKEATACASSTDASVRSVKTLSEQVTLSQKGPIMEVSKSVFIFGNRDPMHGKGTLNKAVDSELPLNLNNITEAKIKKAGGGTRFFSRPPPTSRNPYLSASLATPIVRRSAVNAARPLHGVYTGNDKGLECKSLRVTRDVRVTVQAHACGKRNDLKKEGHMGKPQETDPPNDVDLQKSDVGSKEPVDPAQLERNDQLEVGSKDSAAVSHNESREEKRCMQGVSKGQEAILEIDSLAAPIVQDKSADIQTRDNEDSITNTLEKFLENLQITSHDDELVSNKEHHESREPISKAMNAKEHQEKVNPHQKECATEQDSIQTHQYMGDDLLEDEAVTSNHAAESDSVQSQSEENAFACDHKDDGAELLQMTEPLSCEDESNPSSAASLVSSNDGVDVKDEALSVENDMRPKKVLQKQHTKDWQKCRGTKRKSSELNLNCPSKDHNHGTQKFKQSSNTAKVPMISSSQRPGLQNSCEESHKKLKTATHAFKPFRFRTEERGALKELGLCKKELGSPKKTKDMVHHALRMPSFGRPFRPQRSTKKLTIPREPKFHVSRTKNAGTSLPTTDLPSS